jgi:hypothetical protein
MIKVLPDSLEKQKENWEYTGDWRIPLIPKFKIRCAVCGNEDVRFKEYYPHLREYKVTGKQPRIDMTYKCCNCAYVWKHGVHITEDYYWKIIEKMQEELGRIRPIHILEIIDRENKLI